MDDPSDVAADSALLFVHGIGAQRAGDTLSQWSDAVRSYLLRVAEVNDREGGSSGLSGVDHLPEANGHVRCCEAWTLRYRDGTTSLVLATESWWAETFPAPSPDTLTRWSFLVFPRFALFHVWAAHVRTWRAAADDMRGRPAASGEPETKPRRGRRNVRILLLGLVMPASLVLRLLAVVGLLAGILIAQQLHRARRPGPMEWLVAYLGDSLAAVADDEFAGEARRRMIECINDDISRCLKQVHPDGTLVVVAHSQGAMLTRQALAERPDARRIVLRTVGAGVAPLNELVGAEARRTAAAAWVALIATTIGTVASLAGVLNGFALVLGALAVSGPVETSTGRALVELLVPLALVFTVCWLVRRASGLPGVLWRLSDLSLDGKVDDWLELSAQGDPVSCGPLLDGLATPTATVGNSYNPFAQHNRYHLNPYVIWTIVAHLPAPFASSEAMSRLEGAAYNWSWRRVLWLRVVGSTGLLMLTALLWLAFSTLR